MSKFNRAAKVNRGLKLTHGAWVAQASPVITETVVSGHTFEGAPGYARDPRGELFLLAVANMAGEDTFYGVTRSRPGSR